MFEQAETLIQKRLADNWATTPIDYDNVAYKPVAGTPFVRLQIHWFSASQTSIGGRVKGEGYIDLSIFTTLGKGTRNAATMADTLAALFNRYEVDALKFKIGSTERVGQTEEWYHLKLIIPFTYDFCIN